MNTNKMKFCTLVMSGILCLTMLCGCSSKEKSSSSENYDTTQAQQENQESQDTSSDEEFKPFTGTSVGDFTTQDINGETYTQDMFKDYDLTLINVYTTWCTPCVEEVPELEKLHNLMKDKNVNVVGVILDVLDEEGNIQQDALERAKELVEQTGATYPMLLPDSTYMNGRLIGIEAFPETFFVDKDGNIVGGTYSGSGDLEDWTEVVEQELADLKGEK